MVIEFICNMYFALLNAVVSIFPQFPSFEQLNIDLSPVFSVVRLTNTFINLGLIGVCMSIVLVIYNIKFIWSIVMWIVRKIPGVS